MDAPCMGCECCESWLWRDKQKETEMRGLFELLVNRIYNVRAEFRIAPPSFDERRAIDRYMGRGADGSSES